MSRYTINKRFKSSVQRTPRIVEVAQAFGLGLSDKEFVLYDNLALDIEDGDLIYITGQSGSGKSVIIHELKNQMRAKGKSVMSIDEVIIKDDVALIDQIGTDMSDALRLLSIAGLNDAYLFVRKPGELSDGQRYRFRLAKLIESGAKVWVADEFGAVLDRVTARVIAYNLQRIAKKMKVTAIIATTHTDLLDDFNPSLYIEKRYREKVKVEQRGEYDDDSGK